MLNKLTAIILMISLGFFGFTNVEAQSSNQLGDNSHNSAILRSVLLKLIAHRALQNNFVEAPRTNPSTSFPNQSASNVLIESSLKNNAVLGDSSSEILLLNQFLADSGYLNQSFVTNNFTSQTKEALRLYQADQNISPTGELNTVTRSLVNLNSARNNTISPTRLSGFSSLSNTASGSTSFSASNDGLVFHEGRLPTESELRSFGSSSSEVQTVRSLNDLSDNNQPTSLSSDRFSGTSGEGSLSPSNQNQTSTSSTNSKDAFSDLLGMAGSTALRQVVKPFGGQIAFSIPCTCTPGYYIKLRDGTDLMYLPIASDINAYFNIFTPGVQVIGTSLPIKIPCFQGLGVAGIGFPSCAKLNSGKLIRVIGTSALPTR